MNYPIPNNESKRLEAIRRYNLLDTNPEQPFDDFILIASQICDTPIALITLVDANRQWFKARRGLAIPETPREQAFCAHTIMGNETMVVEDALNDKRFFQNPLVTGEPKIRFYAGAPLVDRDGFGLGSLCVIDQKARQLTKEQQLSLEALSRLVVNQIECRRSSAELAEALGEIKVLQDILPICSHCKKIRDDEGFWQSVEKYITTHSTSTFSHGICPACLKTHYADLFPPLAREQK